jgi:hypothetical protein
MVTQITGTLLGIFKFTLRKGPCEHLRVADESEHQLATGSGQSLPVGPGRAGYIALVRTSDSPTCDTGTDGDGHGPCSAGIWMDGEDDLFTIACRIRWTPNMCVYVMVTS